MKHEKIIKNLTLHEKAALLKGENVWQTRSVHGLPQIFLSDGPHGLRKQAGNADCLGLNASLPATCFPTASALANSRDEALLEEIGEALGKEAAALGANVLLGPGLNIKRSPLCGRNFEYFSEDPLLSGKLAAAMIRGIQSQGVAACPKHFAANSQETLRMSSDSIIDEKTLREIYLTGFEIAVKEGNPKAIMSAYNKVNGEYAHENRHLLIDILRNEWGFDGAVISDWGGVNDVVKSVKNGGTLEMPGGGFDSARQIVAAAESGDLPAGDLDARVDEVIELILSTQIKEKPTVDFKAHHALARKAAEKSIVLLKNEGEILPLKPGKKIAVIGEFAEKPRFQGAGSSHRVLKLTNTGDYDGDETARIYDEKGGLIGFKRVHIKKGESVAIDITPYKYAQYKSESFTFPSRKDWFETGKFGKNNTISQLKYSKNRLCRFVAKIYERMITESLAKGKPDLNLIFGYNLPFRGIARQAGEPFSDEMVDGIVLIANAHLFKGLGKVIGGFFRNKKANKLYAEKLKGGTK